MTYRDEVQATKDRLARIGTPAPRFLLPPDRYYIQFPHDTPCKCGLRYGMHRVNDYACPNQAGRPGNGKPQWLTARFERA